MPAIIARTPLEKTSGMNMKTMQTRNMYAKVIDCGTFCFVLQS